MTSPSTTQAGGTPRHIRQLFVPRLSDAIGRLVRRVHLHRLGQGRDCDPDGDERHRSGPGQIDQVAAWRFIDDLEQHAPREIAHDFLVEIPPSGRFRDAP
jgi:hypothetical protein